MLSKRNRETVKKTLDGALGVGKSLKGNERTFYCPFCHHHKKKLQVNLESQQWHCWVCDSKGRSIGYLLSKLNVDYNKIQKINDIYGETSYSDYKPTKEEQVELFLPKEYKPLKDKPKSVNPYYNKALAYLKSRDISMDEVIKYQIGYCEDGLYGGRIIIPSYDGEGNLNYFVARAFYEDAFMNYKNPPVNRNVIVFENHINWNEPITLVEGVFDSFSVRRNAIPLLGKFLPQKLKDKIFEENVKEVNIVLDEDAVNQSSKYTDYFTKNGIKVRNIVPQLGDPSDLGFEVTTNMIREKRHSTWDDIVFTKLENI